MLTFHNYEQKAGFTSRKNSKVTKKRYDCNLCSKYFNRPSALQTHVYTHTGEKPHMCDTPGCGRRFAVISNLRRHLRVHQSSNVNRRLSSQERRQYVEKLIQKSNGFTHNEHVFTSLSCSNKNDSSSLSSGYLYPIIENNYRLLKPKQARPLCLTVKHLL
ncbi:uncharacterized protein BX663DRAFT_497916, partial [Cokeromyces recurvatus]|uniref:uncharacterized protein n=1 Tax=Cokeromyces recurvatus TaxID=90255 RepID=UPI00221FFB39